MIKIPVSKPTLTDQCKKFATHAIETECISGVFGEYIHLFECEFAQYTGTNYAISCSSGTTAIHLALIAAGVTVGDEVLVSTTTNMATFFAVEYIGATPIPVDIDPLTYTIDILDLESKITNKTKAILCVHLFGQLCNMEALCQIAKEFDIKIIEDCAESHGASFKDRKAGSFGDFGAFSFFSNKLLTCGEGGIVTTNCEHAALRMKELRSLSFGEKNKFMHKELGYNYRLSNVACAIGYSQTLQADSLINGRIDICKRYIAAFQKYENVLRSPVARANYKNTFWMAHFELTGVLKNKRNEFTNRLEEVGVETRQGFFPYHLQRYHGKLFDRNYCPNASAASTSTLYFPTYNLMTDLEFEHVSSSVCKVIEEFVNG